MARRDPADTPLMRQFLQVKAEHPTGILFFRMGDFYEMFFEDAVIAAKALDLTLTSRDKGKPDAVPMCGLPHHASRGYIARLTEQGFKVVICEQVEDPKTAKGLVKRDVVQIVTPGVVVDDEVLDPKSARYLASVVPQTRGPRWGLAYVDVSTGEFRATEVDSIAELAAELSRVAPREILVSQKELAGASMKKLCERFKVAYTEIERRGTDEVSSLLETSFAASLVELGLEDKPLAAQAAADTLQYARATQPTGSLPLTRLQLYQPGQAVVLDEASILKQSDGKTRTKLIEHFKDVPMRKRSLAARRRARCSRFLTAQRQPRAGECCAVGSSIHFWRLRPSLRVTMRFST